jgi:ubiquitin carboxyl-terminal hydrolase 20/33
LEDSQEFLRCVLDRLEEELRVKQNNPTVHNNNNNNMDAHNTQDMSSKATDSLLRSVNIVKEVFEGESVSKVYCEGCQETYETMEPFLDISLAIPQGPSLPSSPSLSVLSEQLRENSTPISEKTKETSAVNCAPSSNQTDDNSNNIEQQGMLSRWSWGLVDWMWSWMESYFLSPLGIKKRKVLLESCLNLFVSPEKLDGNNQFYCEKKCKKKCDALRSIWIHKLPEVLVLHVKRFRHDSYFSSKISDLIDFPTELNMRPFLQSTNKPEPPKEMNMEDPKGTPSSHLYDLIGVVEHLGSLGGGHYVSYVRRPDMGGKFFCFDDSSVHSVSTAEMENVEAYVLFYRKRGSVFSNTQSSLQGISNESYLIPDEKVIELFPDLISLQNGFHKQNDYLLFPKEWCFLKLFFPQKNYSFHFDSLRCDHGVLHPKIAQKTHFVCISGHLGKQLLALWNIQGKFLIPEDLDKNCPDCVKALEELEQRRQKEKEEVLRLDQQVMELAEKKRREKWDVQSQKVEEKCDDGEMKEEEVSFVVPVPWIEKWQKFASGQSDEIPGPIDNTTLLVSTEKTTTGEVPWKRNIKKGIHFRLLDPLIWDYLYKIYGGGPILKCYST